MKLTYKKRGDFEALEQFLYGLQGDLEQQVRAANPKTLVEAITVAVRAEQRTGARRVGTQSDPVSAEGILTELMEKYANLKDDNQLEATIRRAPAKARCGVCGMDNDPKDRCQYNDTETKFCIFCQKKGHQYGDCYALQKALKNGKVTLGNLDKPGRTPSPSLPPQVVYTPYPMDTALPLTYPAAGYPSQTLNANARAGPDDMHRQGQRNYEGRPDRYLNRDPRDNRDARWRPEYRPNNYRNHGGRGNRDMRYRPNYNENSRDDRINRYARDGYQDRNEDRSVYSPEQRSAL